MQAPSCLNKEKNVSLKMKKEEEEPEDVATLVHAYPLQTASEYVQDGGVYIHRA